MQRHNHESVYPTYTLESEDCPHPPHLTDEKIKDHIGEGLKSLMKSHWQREGLKHAAFPFLPTASHGGDFPLWLP